jgi:hypothetical protein
LKLFTIMQRIVFKWQIRGNHFFSAIPGVETWLAAHSTTELPTELSPSLHLIRSIILVVLQYSITTHTSVIMQRIAFKWQIRGNHTYATQRDCKMGRSDNCTKRHAQLCIKEVLICIWEHINCLPNVVCLCLATQCNEQNVKTLTNMTYVPLTTSTPLLLECKELSSSGERQSFVCTPPALLFI